jgi:hypothetical protein
MFAISFFKRSTEDTDHMETDSGAWMMFSWAFGMVVGYIIGRRSRPTSPPERPD